MHSRFRRPLIALLIALSLLGALASPAMADRDFATRFITNVNGDITMASNSVLTCPGTGTSCTTARSGGGSANYNDNYTMTNIDVDSDSTTFNSSTSNLTIPSGATVLFAGLYWGADTAQGTGGSAAPAAANRGTVQLKAPGASAYTAVTASQVDASTSSATNYQGFADVTSTVAAAGGGTYAVANVQAGTGAARYGGWSLVVAYSRSTDPAKTLSISDGYVTIAAPGGSGLITVPNLAAPSTGTINAKLGVVSYEGEVSLSPDSATINGTSVSDASNPATNFFNSTISAAGANVTTRNPAYASTLGYDADLLTANGVLPTGASSTSVAVSTDTDQFYVGVIGLAVDSTKVVAQSTTPPTVSGTTRDGQTLTTTDGTWAGSAPFTYAYQWQRCDSAGANCADISGATSATYTLVSADVGKTIRSRVTATNSVGSSTQASAVTAVIAGNAPANTVAPSVTGTLADGQTISATNGTWTGSTPLTYTYQWQRCDSAGANCADISGATSQTYALVSTDVGKTFKVKVTATNTTGNATASSSASGAVAAVAPSSSAAPVVTGTTRDGQTLTTTNGTWTGTTPLTYAYQWQRCDSAGANCADISGATASTYVLVSADVGKTIRSRVTASNSGGTTSQASAVTAVITGNAPANTVVPTISGTVRDGQTLSVANGTWTGSTPLTYTYQWQRCDSSGGNCADISGATSQTYVLVSGDVAGTVKAKVTATNTAGNATASTVASAVVAGNAPSNAAAPVVSGTTRDGQTLTTTNGTWTGTTPLTYTYQWQRCDSAGANCADISGATGATYALVSADVGKTIRSKVTATNSTGNATQSSAASAVIDALAPAGVTAPAISGTVRDGQTLSATNGTWTGSTPLTYTYQWQRCDSAGANCADISGATAATYTLVSADVGGKVRIKVTATNSAGNATQTSAVSSAVTGNAPANTAAPAVSGTTRDGQTLTTTNGTWTGSTPLTYTYQWQRCDSAGANCADISGATSQTYALVSADVGKTIKSKVTATNSTGNATQASAATAVIAGNPPVNQTAPTVSGTPVIGQTLATTDGTWSGSTPITYTYGWQRCDTSGANCTDISGATSSSYTLTAADIGKSIRSKVTATNTAGNATQSSSATGTITAIPPSGLTVPVVSGTARDGQTISATDGTWAGTTPLTYTYQWQRCDSAGANCADISGATAATYTLVSADVGSKLRIRVTATNTAGSASQNSAVTATATGNAPANTAAPAVSGTTRDGQTLTTTNGTWTGSTPLTYTYQWQRCDSAGANCADISGATSQTYSLVSADVGKTIKSKVTATNSTGNATQASAATAVIAGNAPVNTVAPAVSGTTRDGQTLTTTNGTWTGSTPLTYAYQWQRCDSSGGNCADISGATSQTYVLVAADVGKTVRSRVTATNTAGNATQASAVTAVVTGNAPANSAPPAISGTTRDGQTLSASNGTWTGSTPMTFGYQWQRCDSAGANCADISGATSQTYSLVSADVGKTMKVKVTATNAAGSTTQASAVSSVVTGNAPVNTTAPSISGTVRDGQTLTAANGTWTGSTPLTYTYQWQRCDSSGANCADIAGATSQSYPLGSSDVGRTIRVRVTATNMAGNATASSSVTASVAGIAPSGDAPPQLSGQTTEGFTLDTTNGSWTGSTPLTYTYQWQRCDSSGANCTDISGATDPSYDLVSADIGKTIRSRVTATNSTGNATQSSAASDVIAARPPVNTIAPAVSGTNFEGRTLSADRGTWTGTDPITYTYQWQRCDAAGANCADIDGATGASYDLAVADLGKKIRVNVKGTNAGGNAVASSALTAAIEARVPVNSAAPSISGDPTESKTLTADPGTWTGTEPITFAYQWLRCDADGQNCTPISGATGRTYDLVPGDVGHGIRVRVTAENAGGRTDAGTPSAGPVAARPPVNTVRPALSGNEVEGSTISADLGTWTGTEAIAYDRQWQRCDSSGQNCTDIAGETGATHALVPADIGNRLRVSVKATNAGGDATAVSDPTAQIAARKPVIDASPSISGDETEASTLTADPGTWTGTEPITLAYQWQRCDSAGANCADISGETARTHDLIPADVGHVLRAVVTASNVGGDTSASSAGTAKIAARPPVNTSLPTIAGQPREGSTLSADEGTWTGTEPMYVTFQWLRCDESGDPCTEIGGATGSTYDLVPADVGHAIRVRVTVTNAGGEASERSGGTAVIAARPPVTSNGPAVNGTPREGNILTADEGLWTGTQPIDLAVAWLRCDASGQSCVVIPGETSHTYALTPDDIGHRIRISVTATNAGGSVTQQSAPTATVTGRAPLNLSVPTTSGAATEGETLTAARGSWSGTDPLAYTYQWQRCDASGANCSDIAGATGSNYALTAADTGSRIRVKVTATNGIGSASATSVPSAAVSAKTPETPVEPTQPTQPTQPDLSTLPGSLIGAASCQQASAARVGTVKLKGVGRLKFKVLATDGSITSATPMTAGLGVSTAKAKKIGKKVRSVAYKLDGKNLATSRRAPYAVKIPPSRLAAATTHTLSVSAASKKGRKSAVNVSFSTAPCAALFTANERSHGGRGTLRLRVDSRTAISTISFQIPSKLLPKAGKGSAGKLQLVGTNGAGQTFKVPLKRGATVPAGSPKVVISGTRVTVSELPADTGIAKLELVRTKGAKPLKRQVSISAAVTTTTGTTTLRARVGPKPKKH